jgi:hypothetical protein
VRAHAGLTQIRFEKISEHIVTDPAHEMRLDA